MTAYRNIYGEWIVSDGSRMPKTVEAEFLEAVGIEVVGTRLCPSPEEARWLEAVADRNRGAIVNGWLSVQLSDGGPDEAFLDGVRAARLR